jgi:hypothetical protein
MTIFNTVSRNTTTYGTLSRNDTDYGLSGGVASYLLKEDSFYLLLENGDQIILSDGTGGGGAVTRNVTSFSTITRN